MDAQRSAAGRMAETETSVPGDHLDSRAEHEQSLRSCAEVDWPSGHKIRED
jgi:hypothetical protein